MLDRFNSLRGPILKLTALTALIALTGFVAAAMAQESGENQNNGGDPLDTALKGLELRTIGPAFMSGRIADVVIHPENRNVWYVGVGSGGVWKTTNSGTTWEPIFDGQGAYSIGDVALNPSNPNTIWVGTGEKSAAGTSATATVSTSATTAAPTGKTSGSSVPSTSARSWFIRRIPTRSG